MSCSSEQNMNNNRPSLRRVARWRQRARPSRPPERKWEAMAARWKRKWNRPHPPKSHHGTCREIPPTTKQSSSPDPPHSARAPTQPPSPPSWELPPSLPHPPIVAPQPPPPPLSPLPLLPRCHRQLPCRRARQITYRSPHTAEDAPRFRVGARVSLFPVGYIFFQNHLSGRFLSVSVKK